MPSTENTARHYCPTTHADATPCGGTAAWGSARRMERAAVALLTLHAMGGVDFDAQTYRCPLTGAVVPFGTAFDVDRTVAGACYVQGAFVLTTKAGNAARNTQGDPSEAWTARYVQAVAAAAATVTVPNAAECARLYRLIAPREVAVTISDTPWW